MKALFFNYSEISWIGWTPVMGESCIPANSMRLKPIVVADKVEASMIQFDKGAYSSPHEHADVQIGFCLKGKVEFIIRDDSGEWTQMVTAGMAYVLPPNVAHGERVLEDTELIEIWSPSDRHKENAKKNGLLIELE